MNVLMSLPTVEELEAELGAKRAERSGSAERRQTDKIIQYRNGEKRALAPLTSER